MPWLPLAILLVAALTIAALALILFPPGEVRDQVAEGDITEEAEEEAAEDDLSPPSVDGDPPLRGEGEDDPPEAEPLADPNSRRGQNASP